MNDELVDPHRYRAVLQGRYVPPPPRVIDPSDTLTMANFGNYIKVELRRRGSSGSSWLMWVTLYGKCTRRKDFATPYLDHGRRCAEEWYGEPLGGWHAPDADIGTQRFGPGSAGAGENKTKRAG